MQNIETNKFQTAITEDLLNLYPQEVQEQFFDYINSVEFIKWLISPDRPYAKDCPRDTDGRIIVDLAHPHIVENMDYFRQPALHFLKYGCYTNLRPNSNPHSEYRKFWEREIDRSLNGYVRESDGEWVTGYCYWFLNYNPMMVNIIKEGTRRASREEAFPFFFEGIYWRFHYLEQARLAGKHAIELARRGAHPYEQTIYTPDGVKTFGELKVGDKVFGTYNNIATVIDIPYDSITGYYKLTLADGREVLSSGEHLWNVGISSKRKLGVVTVNEMVNDPHFRLKNGLYKYAIPLNLGVEYSAKDVPIDPYTFGVLLGDGTFKHTSIELAADKGDIEALKNNIPYEIKQCDNSGVHYTVKIDKGKLKIKELGLSETISKTKFIPELYKYNSREVRLAVLQGLMDTDGWASKKRSPQLCTVSETLKDDVLWLARSLGYKAQYIKKNSGYKIDGVYIECSPSYTITICGGEELFRFERKKRIVRSNTPVFKPFVSITKIEYVDDGRCKCIEVDSEDGSYLIGDFITTHNCAKSYTLSAMMTRNLILGLSNTSRKRTITTLVAYQKEYLKDDKDGTFSKFKPSLNFLRANTPFPRLMLKNSPNEMSWQMGYKDDAGIDRGSFNSVIGVSAKDDPDKCRGKRSDFYIEEMGTFSGLLAFYDTIRKGVEDGNFAFNLIFLVGTANESESDFSSAKVLLYNPDGYNLYAIPNVFDKRGQGRANFGFFFPAYINRAGCYNKDGVSDVIKALLEILLARYKAKYSADPQSVLRVIAEDPITPAEAIIKVRASYFPTPSLTERLSELDADPNAYNDVYVGDLVLKGGEIVFTPTADIPIHKYGVENSTRGAIEIFEMPEKNKEGKVYNNRYIIGHDPVDNDQANSSSLSSTFVFDLFTDKIVAEYTGRQPFADDNFEIVRKLCIFYNAKCLYESNKKGLFAYFSKTNCTHYLAETPEYLREKQLVKYSSFGSNKYGVNANAAINDYANSLLRDWLLKPNIVYVKQPSGEMTEETIPMLYSIRNRALLEELISYTPELNVDRIRAMGMVMLYRQEKIILYQGNMSADREDKYNSNYLGNDDFFVRNYDKRQLRRSKIS